MPLNDDMSMVRNDQMSYDIIGNFETISSWLLPYDIVAKKRSARDKRNHADVFQKLSKFEVASSSVTPKPAIWNTGVDFKYYKRD